MNISELVIRKEGTSSLKLAGTILRYNILSVDYLPKERQYIMGVDPGRNFGMTFITPEYTTIWYGKMPEGELSYGRLAFELSKYAILEHHIEDVIVEGASYGDYFGQVLLAEIRFGFYLGGDVLKRDVKVVPPQTSRKAVCGNGRTRGSDLRPEFNPNAMDSLVIALYGIKQE